MRCLPGFFLLLSMTFTLTAPSVCAGEESRSRESELSDDETPPDNKKIDAAYKAALKSNKCDKKQWSRYKHSEFFISAAAEGKITPYDVAWGDAYTRRNVPATRTLFLMSHLSDYLVEMPEAIHNKFNQEFPTEAAKEKNQKAVFNTSIKRDYDCYKKLK